MSPTRLLVGVALAIATSSLAAAQSHADPQEVPAAKSQAGPAGHDASHEAPPKKKVPTVSRLAPLASAPAAAAHEPAHAPTSAASRGGYVATGARPKAGATAPKKKPVVSGLGSTPVGAGDHGDDAGDAPQGSSAAGHDAPDPQASTAEHGAAPPAPSASAGVASPAPKNSEPAGTRPAKLADVHERIATALAGLRDERTPGGSRTADDDRGAPGRNPLHLAPRLPRVVLTWPGPRWRVRWPEAATTDQPLAPPPLTSTPLPPPH